MHLTPAEVAEFVDGVATPEATARIQAHLAECVECRDEVVETGDVVASLRGPSWTRRVMQWAPAVAAAAIVFILLRPATSPPPTHREPPITATAAPTIVVPIGDVDSVPLLVWHVVPGADGYVARIFDRGGTVVWEQTVSDTTVRPRDAKLTPAVTYYLEVKARIGFERYAASEQIPFTITPRRE